MAFDAAWGPAKKVFFSHRDWIWSINEDGSDPKRLLKAPDPPRELGWSADGKRLWYITRNSGNPEPAIWEAASDGRSQRRVWPEHGEHSEICCGFWLANREAFGFLLSSNHEPTLMLERAEAWPPLAGANWFPLRLSPAFSKTAFGLPGVDRLVTDAAHNRFLALSPGPWRGKTYRLDPGTKRLHPFMEGIAARDVDYSPDGRTVVYIDSYDNSLWRYDPDRHVKTPLIRPPFVSSLPRWSPDGQSIALSGMGSDKIWRIYRISPRGGTPEPVIANDTDGGAPTWSKDGQSLVFGKIACAWLDDCGIYQYDFTSHSLHMLPGSQGFRTARWSPNGRYIAALRPSDQSLMLFDCGSGRWRRIYGPVAGDCLAWSHDSHYIYVHLAVGGGHFIYRVRVPSAAAAEVADLKDLQAYGTERGVWFGLAPDDSLLVVEAMVSNEIFSVSYQMP
jgi:Tol biopolymer transport system component